MPRRAASRAIDARFRSDRGRRLQTPIETPQAASLRRILAGSRGPSKHWAYPGLFGSPRPTRSASSSGSPSALRTCADWSRVRLHLRPILQAPLTLPVFQFAPSPNGYLHLGHASLALLNEAFAVRFGGRLLSRIEDIDITRCRPEFIAACEDDLAWLGLRFERPVRRQSEHFGESRYRRLFQALPPTCHLSVLLLQARSGREREGPTEKRLVANAEGSRRRAALPGHM